MLEAPGFWAAEARSPWPSLLQPLAALYALGNRLHRRTAAAEGCGAPLLSVGNLVAGGAGKTPTVAAIAAMVARQGQRPHVVSRGYGGRLRGPVRVEPGRHTAAEVGDEPLLLAQVVPVWIGRDRVAAARAAVAAGASCIVADDAHQTYALHRTLSLLVVDAAYGFGNGRMLPAGPLREPLAVGLARSAAIVLIGEPGASLPPFGDRPVFRASLVPDAEDAARLRQQRVLAFAGIARPEKFFASLRQIGANIVEQRPFPDHAAYDEDRIMRLVEAAHAQNAIPVTTAKDLARFPAEARAMVQVLRVALRFADPEAVGRFLLSRLQHV